LTIIKKDSRFFETKVLKMTGFYILFGVSALLTWHWGSKYERTRGMMAVDPTSRTRRKHKKNTRVFVASLTGVIISLIVIAVDFLS
jgi:hypothetical protein